LVEIGKEKWWSGTGKELPTEKPRVQSLNLFGSMHGINKIGESFNQAFLSVI